ncbi:MAG: amidohydrolase family protein [Bacteroidia bacterium]
MKTCFASLLFLMSVSTALFSQSSYAIQHVDVIPMDKEMLLKNQTVLISLGKIEAIGSSPSLKIPEGYTLIDGSGKYLMPGLTDMHAHFFEEQYKDHKSTAEAELKLMLANGMTSARIMAGHPDYLQAKEKVKTGKWIGPELTVASPQLVGAWPWPADFKNFEIVPTPEKAADAVRKFKAEGYDAIKITFMVKADCYKAIISTAKESGIPVTGHVGPGVKLPAALAAKQQIEHMDEFIDMLLPDTSYNHGQSVSDMNIWRKPAWATVPHLDTTKIPALVQMVKDAGISVTPTNYFFISSFGQIPPEEEIRRKPDYGFIPGALMQERWDNRKAFISRDIPAASREIFIRIRKKLVYDLWKAGVPLMAGSDSPEFFLVTGFALHDELAAFADAGLTPFATLQTATTNPARYLKTEQRKGTIAVGKDADLVLLNKNPLENIRNTTSVNAVFNKGVYYDRGTLDKWLQEIKQKLK